MFITWWVPASLLWVSSFLCSQHHIASYICQPLSLAIRHPEIAPLLPHHLLYPVSPSVWPSVTLKLLLYFQSTHVLCSHPPSDQASKHFYCVTSSPSHTFVFYESHTLSLCCVFCLLAVMCCAKLIFWPCQFRDRCDSCTEGRSFHGVEYCFIENISYYTDIELLFSDQYLWILFFMFFLPYFIHIF